MTNLTVGACIDTRLKAAVESAEVLKSIWGDDPDQIEAHLESERFRQIVVDQAMMMAGVDCA